MEKDLRDAYAALKLLRADLVKTRRDKRALEASLSHQQTDGPPPDAAQTREMQQMQHEDANCQLWRMAAKYEARLAEMEDQLLHNNCQKKEEGPEVDDNQLEELDDEGLEKLALLNKLHSLTATVEQQTQTMLAQQAAFALQRGELERRLEDAEHKLQAEMTQVTDAVLGQQAAKEKYEFLETQVEILKDEKYQLETKLATHVQTSIILKQQLQEREEERVGRESELEELELKLQLEYEQKMDTLMEEANLRTRNESEMEQKRAREEYQRKVEELQQKCERLESKLSSEKKILLRDHEEVQEQYATTLRNLENNCDELRVRLACSEAERTAEAKKHEEKLMEVSERYISKLHAQGSELEDVKNQLATSKATRSTETIELEMKLTEALKEMQETREQYAVTLRNHVHNLAEAQSLLAASNVKLEKEARNHEEQLSRALQKLHNKQDELKHKAMSLCDLENKLEKLQEKLADTEAKRLSQVQKLEAKRGEASQLAEQHEKTACTLAMENKALRQEVCEARQTSKLTAEEFLKCHSVMEQKTQEHLQYLAQAQKQCESLETQLLAAEDHQEPSRGTKSVGKPFALKAFHGLSDNEIAALPSSKSWALLRSGITEVDGFLPQLQTLLSVIHDSLALCGGHADILPTLWERLQGKGINEKGQLPVLATALNLLHFTVILKARIAQEESPVTQNVARTFRRRVLDALAQWCECDVGASAHGGNEEMPTPTFTITSRETELILQNWTQNRTKQLGVRRWLARMEAYPGVPPLRGASSNRVLELPPEGCTLELEDMTPEVKDAFRLLLIPILKQNRALYVRVFTRYAGGRESQNKQRHREPNGDEESDDGAEKVWAMRIHVQSAITVRARSNGSIRPAPLSLTPSPRGFASPLAPASPASSVSSSASSTASSRLQIIQERLQYLHNNA
uniref:Uncharacterized protein n=1 Tax=Phytophthora ramorum TaxID=164328 RepID=H3GDM4_PHYRM